MLAIVITDSTGYSHFHPLPAENGRRFTLGRAAECDFSLPEEETLADYHCMLTLVDGFVYLQAYDSQYGIFCGSREVREEYMTNEREYALGSCRLMLTQTEDEPAPATVTRVAKLQPKSVTRVAKLQPKSVTQAPQQPTTPTVNRVAKLQPKSVTRVAKLQPKSVTTAAAPQPTYEAPAEPVYAAPAEPAYEAPAEPVYAAPAEPAYEAPAEPVYAAPTEPAYEAPAEPVYAAPAEPAYEAPAESVYAAPAEPAYEAPAEPAYEAPAEPVYAAPAEPAAVAVATQIPAVTKSPKKKSTGTRKAVKTAGTGTRKGVKTAGTGKPKAFKTAAGTVAGKKKTEKTPAAVAAPAKKVRSAAGGTGKKKAAARAVAKPTYAPEPPRSGLLAKLPTDFTLKLRLANTEETLNIGTDLRFGLTTDRNCYIYLLQYDCEGNPGLLVPGMAGITNALHAEVESQFPNVGNKEYKLVVEPPVGQELIVAIACSKPVDFDSAWRTVVSACASAPEPGQAELQAIEICAAEGLTWSSTILNIRTVQ